MSVRRKGEGEVNVCGVISLIHFDANFVNSLLEDLGSLITNFS